MTRFMWFGDIVLIFNPTYLLLPLFHLLAASRGDVRHLSADCRSWSKQTKVQYISPKETLYGCFCRTAVASATTRSGRVKH